MGDEPAPRPAPAHGNLHPPGPQPPGAVLDAFPLGPGGGEAEVRLERTDLLAPGEQQHGPTRDEPGLHPTGSRSPHPGGGVAMTSSAPSITAATISAHCSTGGAATRNNRSTATPSSAAASTPSEGMPTTPSQAPAADGPAASANASEVAATPSVTTTLPRRKPAGRSVSRAGTTASVRSWARAPGPTRSDRAASRCLGTSRITATR